MSKIIIFRTKTQRLPQNLQIKTREKRELGVDNAFEICYDRTDEEELRRYKM
ncbi:MAG: hypothetical protein ACKPBD_08575 [Dolichospermum sp.]